ncbi:MAG: hypothetical protein WA395_03870 [Nitrososphaeraceae archaeon]
MSISIQIANNSYPPGQIEKLPSKEMRSNTSHNSRIAHKNLLLCNSCSWSVSYTDYSDTLNIMQEYTTVTCPVCKDGRIKSSMMIL